MTQIKAQGRGKALHATNQSLYLSSTNPNHSPHPTKQTYVVNALDPSFEGHISNTLKAFKETTYTNSTLNMSVQRKLILFLEEQNNESRSQNLFLPSLEAIEPLVSFATINGLGKVDTFKFYAHIKKLVCKI